MAEQIIQVRNLSKRYILHHNVNMQESLREMITRKLRFMPPESTGSDEQEEFWALKNISFDIERGSCVGIIGKNGAGKSTLLKILSRITLPTTGEARLRGRVGSLLEVGTGFHGDLTGRENIFLNGSILGMSKREINNRFDEIVQFAEVSKFLDTPVKRYSSGMYMRLAFSIAAHLEPEILIVDEVLAVGDIDFQQKCLGKMDDLRKNKGRTILFVSHNLDAIYNLCDRAILLENGVIANDNVPAKTIAQYIQQTTQTLSAEFPIQPDKPCITAVSLDENDLALGNLNLTITYSSPILINEPIPGFVLYNAMNMPVLGSNPRYHNKNYTSSPSNHGVCTATINDLELHSGKYKISIWLGDHYHDYDVKHEAIIFDYENPRKYMHLPNTLYTGSVDKICQWEWKNQPAEG